jgi:hypothetical protein
MEKKYKIDIMEELDDNDGSGFDLLIDELDCRPKPVNN